MRAVRLVAAVAALSSILPVAVARASVSISARLIDFTPWLQPEGVLRAELEVINSGSEPLARFQVSLGIHEGIDTRSQLERSFTGSLGSVVGSDTIPVDITLAPGASETISIEKPLSEMRFFSANPDDRAYPVRFVVRSGRTSAPPLDTHMIFFSRPAPVPLEVALVVPLHHLPIYDAAMRVASVESARSLTDRTSSLLEVLERFPDTRVAVAPSGLLVDMLSDLADGYSISKNGEDFDAGSPGAVVAARALERIQTIAARTTTQTIVAPYANANLAWLSSNGMGERGLLQVGEGSLRIREKVTKSVSGWLLPASGAVDESALSLIQRSGLDGVILAPSTVPRARTSFTRAAPVQIRTRADTPVAALVSDAGLDTRLRPPPSVTSVVARQRFLAETATIMLERPSQRRVITAVAPGDWDSKRSGFDTILLALAQSPWMRSITPQEAVAQIDAAGSLELLGSETVLGAGPEPPPETYVESLKGSQSAIEQYSDLGPPASRIGALERLLMIAESADWWTSGRLRNRGLAFANAVQSKVAGEFAKITSPAPQTITLTSRNGLIPLVISNKTDYPVRVVITLDSDKLRFPSGTEILSDLNAPAETISVAVVTETSGTFPLRVVVQTPNRGLEISSSRLLVRSTAYNVVAVAITIGAGVFMVFGWVAGAVRRRVASKGP